MANHCYCRLEVYGDHQDVSRLRRRLESSEAAIDFAAAMPPPTKIVADGPSAKAAYEIMYGDWESVCRWASIRAVSRMEAIDLARHDRAAWWCKEGDRSFDEWAEVGRANVAAYGHPDAESWLRANWGTDGNCFDSGWYVHQPAEPGDPEIVGRFTARWSPPVPLLVKLSAELPGLTLRLDYNDFDFGAEGFVTLAAGQTVAEWQRVYEPEEEGPFLWHGNANDDWTGRWAGHVFIGPKDVDGMTVDRRWLNPFVDVKSALPSLIYYEWIYGRLPSGIEEPAGDWYRPTVNEIQWELRNRSIVCTCGNSDQCHGHILMKIAGDCGDERLVESGPRPAANGGEARQ
jgi:hypothetical protein